MTPDPSAHVRPETFRDCWFLTGPTASGKTAVGVRLAERLDAEIVSLDSMALYRGMDIGTAKPSLAERAAVEHHLIDVVDPGEEYSVARYLDDASRAVEQIRARGRQPLFVGGTPLYLKSLLRGIFSGPEADWEIRRRLLEEAKTVGEAALHARLAEVDAASAQRLHPNDLRRVVRALEVYEITGRPLSELQQQHEPQAVGGPAVFVLDWPRPKLHDRIHRRVDEMFVAGLVDEVRRLRAAGPLSHTALQAVGYREVFEHLDGQRDLKSTAELIKIRTRQFAKRQMTWFRSLAECRFIAVDDPFDPDQMADQIVALLNEAS